ncbi:hypothetical protein D3C87_1593440 [compost metagenome]
MISSKGPTKGELKSEFKIAERMIETIQDDPFCVFVLEGQKEVIVTAEFAGTMWKAKLDNLNPDRITDLKTVDCITKKHWDTEYGTYVNFVESRRYVTQMAVYAELDRLKAGREDWLEVLILAVSKEDPPDKEIISIDSGRIQMELEAVKERMPRVLSVKNGLEAPVRCGKCRYCRETKRLTSVTHYMDLVV